MKLTLVAIISVCILAKLAEGQVCGETPIAPKISRIVGGQRATAYSWPWQVGFFVKDDWLGDYLSCGGSLISDQWVMTAGHCVYGRMSDPSKFVIKLGVYNEEKNNENGELVVGIDKIVLHPQYDDQTTAYDISLLHLVKPVTFTDHIQPVCIPETDTNNLNANTLITVTGWGDTKENGQISHKLRQVNVPIVPYSTCNSEYDGEILQNVMFCAGQSGKDSCQGDSGGPAVEKVGNAYYQFGIVSWGYGCAEKGYPGIYSRVTAYTSWITQQTGVTPVSF